MYTSTSLLGWFWIWLVSAAILGIAAYLLPGVRIKNYWVALVVAAIMGLLNLFIRPIILFFTLPLNIITLGLFTFVVDAVIVLIASAIVPDFEVDGFGNALLFAILLAVGQALLFALFAI